MAAAAHNTARGPITGKVVAVNGSSRGIGLGFVKKFLERGNEVYAGVRQVKNANQLHQLATEHPGRLTVVPLDVCDQGSVSSWADLLTQSGVKHVDTNALGPLLCVQQLDQRHLLGSDTPGESSSLSTVIVNITSIMASHGDPVISSKLGGRGSKAALNAINKGLAMDLGPKGVECVVVHPGYVKTDMNAGQGWITVDDSVDDMFKLLEGSQPLNGRFYAHDGQEIPW